MHILVLSKRQYTNRDLIDDRFGRLRELPLALAENGHKVAGVCLSYRHRDEGRHHDMEGNAQVVWHSLNVHRLMPFGSNSYWRMLDSLAAEFSPDLVWACSDAFHALLGVYVAKRIRAKLVIDLYDNFESYTATRFPGITFAFRRALRFADGITCVSRQLSRYVQETSFYKGPIAVIENAVPKGLFYPMDKVACRRELGLPVDGILIGTAGAISRSRGIETLFRAFDLLSRERPDIYLILAGPCDKGLTPPWNSRVHYLGNMPPENVSVFLSALDVSIICNRNSAFGKYCFPQKFYESIACEVPVVVAATGAMDELLQVQHPIFLYEPDNITSLMIALRRQIDNPTTLSLNVPTWTTLGNRLEDFFQGRIKAVGSR